MLPRNQRHRLRMEDSNEGVGLVEEITNVLGKEATRPLARGRARGRKANKIDGKLEIAISIPIISIMIRKYCMAFK